LRHRNPGVPIFALYGGPPDEASRYQAAVGALVDDFWSFPGEKDSAWKWRNGDRVLSRWFTDRDDERRPGVVMISRSFAARFFPGQNPLGEHLAMDHGYVFRAEIVGVVGDVRHRSIAGPAYPTMYVPYTQAPGLRASLVVRGRGDVLATLGMVKREVEALDATVPVFGMHTMDELVSDSVGQPRFRMVLLGLFAGIALLLAAAGIYGVMSYSVTIRMHELGIRAALGARRGDLMKAVVGRGMVWALGGMAVGLTAALGLARALGTSVEALFGDEPPRDVTLECMEYLLSTRGGRQRN